MEASGRMHHSQTSNKDEHSQEEVKKVNGGRIQ